MFKFEIKYDIEKSVCFLCKILLLIGQLLGGALKGTPTLNISSYVPTKHFFY